MNYYPRHLGDYARDAGHLTLAEHGAYTLLLDRYYATERPIGRDEALKICHAISRADRAAVAAVLREFFYLDEKGYWAHKRVEAELDRMKQKQSKARQSAMVRWDADAMRTHSDGNAKAMLSNNQTPITNNQSALAGYPALPKQQRVRNGISRISADSVLKVNWKGEGS